MSKYLLIVFTVLALVACKNTATDVSMSEAVAQEEFISLQGKTIKSVEPVLDAEGSYLWAEISEKAINYSFGPEKSDLHYSKTVENWNGNTVVFEDGSSIAFEGGKTIFTLKDEVEVTDNVVYRKVVCEIVK